MLKPQGNETLEPFPPFPILGYVDFVGLYKKDRSAAVFKIFGTGPNTFMKLEWFLATPLF